MTLLSLLQLGCVMACVAYVHCEVLYNMSSPLNFLYKWITWVDSVAPWFGKPLGACTYCFAGQAGLWAGLFLGYGFASFGVAAVSVVAVHILKTLFPFE